MDDELLASYLDDHLAGAAVGIEIAERLAEADELNEPMTSLTQQLNLDRAALQDIRSRLPVSDSVVKRTVGLVGGILAQVRDRSPLASSPSQMEDLEALAIGIWGKRLLWGTITRVASCDARFEDVDADLLAERAEEQEKTVLRLRIVATDAELELVG